jgi:hypothetical protein
MSEELGRNIDKAQLIQQVLSLMTLDKKMLYFTTADTIMQLLEVLTKWVTKL